MIICLLTGSKYDTSNTNERVRLLHYIPTLRYRGKIKELNYIIEQLGSQPNSPNELEIKQKVENAIVFLSPIKKQPTTAITINLDFNEIKEDGETSFQLLYAYLIKDMMQYAGNIDFLIIYSTVVFNMFMHIATFTPVEGHGKAQSREFKHKTQLQYYRSQGDHANAKFFRLLLGANNLTKSRLPLNRAFIKLISPPDFSENLCQEIKKIDPETGCPKPNETINSFATLKIAHAGARTNNFLTLSKGMKIITDNYKKEDAINSLQKKLQKVLRPTNKIEALNPKTLSLRIQELLKRFKKIKLNSESNQNLSKHLLTYRIQRVKQIQEKIDEMNLNYLKLENESKEITCLMIRLYPDCRVKNDSYKEGVTNVLLSFFSALLNHGIKKRGLQLHAERRQSFGFLRPTLTDAGNLTIRLSLGLEPTVFDDVVIQSLKDLDKLLGKFNFEKKTPEVVAKTFEYTKKKASSGRSPDTYVRNSVRKDDRMLMTFRQAEAYLYQASQSGKKNYIELAMKNFLTEYIVEKKIIDLMDPDIKFQGPIQPCSSTVVDLLKNTLQYALNFVSQLEFLDKNEPLKELAHCYWHSLLKLYKNFDEAQSLLNNLEKIEATEFYRQALIFIENILEYLISLDALKQIRSELQGAPIDPINNLRETELLYCSKTLNISKNQIKLFFTDSGQQAITTSLLVLSLMLHGPAANNKAYDSNVHLFGKAYFEIASFLDDIKKENCISEMPYLKKASIVFVDVSQLDQLPLNECKAMKALVIDTTHYPDYDQEKIRHVIKHLQKENIWIVFVESALKHEQLGLDKYQTGRITFILPASEKRLPKEAEDILDSISNSSIHPCIASYLQMVNEICQKKLKVNAMTNFQLFKLEETKKVTSVSRRVKKLG